MTSTLTETATALCTRYHQQNGFAGAVVDSYNQIILPAGPVDAIQMPGELGHRVRTELTRQLLTVPVIENRDTKYQTFITEAAPADDPRPIQLFANLYRIQAIRTPKGALIMLPGPAADDTRFWLDKPVGTLRPPFETVVAITLEAAKSLPRVVN